MNCQEIQELLPWYPVGLSPEEAALVVSHLRQCPTCQEELAQWRALETLVRKALLAWPEPSPRVWRKVAIRTFGFPLGHVRLGTEAFGFSLSLYVRKKALPILLELFLLGRRVPIFEFGGGAG